MVLLTMQRRALRGVLKTLSHDDWLDNHAICLGVLCLSQWPLVFFCWRQRFAIFGLENLNLLISLRRQHTVSGLLDEVFQ